MKFLCDRCKTRYSIGEERVRGKILKIRCKNCANVITVREGMSDVDSGGDPADRAKRPTTGAPPIVSNAPANGALGAAFASQMTKPPPALEEEWYVSIDGDQSGPFSLGEAQRWVASKSADADLHCWSEGFDDWLPVDKVSHFRGLRKKAKPTTPPPLPRAATRAPAAPPPSEDEPKPLFAATMASLEKNAPISDPAISLPMGGAAIKPALPAPLGNPPSPGLGAKLPSPGFGAKANGSASVPAIPSTKTPTVPGSPLARGGASSNGSVARGATVQGTGAKPSPLGASAQALAAAFKPADPADSMTAVEAPAFNDEIATLGEPVAAKRANDRIDAATTLPTGTPAAKAVRPIMDGDDDDDMEIGEVSRVVNLKDIAAMGPRSAPRTVTGGTGSVGALGRNQTGSVGRITGPVGRITGPVGRVTGPVARLDPAALGEPGAVNPDQVAAMLGTQGQPVPSESVVAASYMKSHRRGMIMLIGASAAILIGGAIAVVVLLQNGGDDLSLGLGGARQIDTSRPEDIARPRQPGEGPTATLNPKNPIKPRTPFGGSFRPNVPVPQQPETTDPTRMSLKADEIEDMASKRGDGTKRCYIRAQKGAMGFEIQDLRKIAVTLTVDKDGKVTDVQLDQHANDTFGKCLIGQIRAWNFRQSPGGTFRISLAFSNG